MRFGLFSMAEYVNMITLSGLCVTLFFGGWLGLGTARPALVRAQGPVLIFLFIWLRATLPRLRYDQLMSFGWKVLPARRDRQCPGHRSTRGGALMSPQPVDSFRGFGVTLSRSSRSRSPSSTPVQAARLPAVPRPPPALAARERPREVRRLLALCRRVPRRLHPRRRGGEHRRHPRLGRRAVRAHLRDQPLRCIFCGYCELACPFDAITLEQEFELSEYSRDDLIYTKDMLLAEPIKRVPVADRDLYDTPIPAYKERS